MQTTGTGSLALLERLLASPWGQETCKAAQKVAALTVKSPRFITRAGLRSTFAAQAVSPVVSLMGVRI